MEQSIWATIVKSNAGYTCIECGSTEFIQAHDPTKKHIDPRDGQCLCAGHHADKHPYLPRALFFNHTNQPYWHNMSAASLAKQFGCHNRTVVRNAKKLGLTNNGTISPEDISLLRQSIKSYKRLVRGVKDTVKKHTTKLKTCWRIRYGLDAELYDRIQTEAARLTITGPGFMRMIAVQYFERRSAPQAEEKKEL